MIGELLPSPVSCAHRSDDADSGGLFPQEEAVVSNAVPERRREFLTVRVCARLAMADLGLPPVQVLPGPFGEPGWPAGVVGSMTHCTGYRAAAVARSGHVRALGIDAEPHAALPEGILEAIALPVERMRVARSAAADSTVHWDRLLFSAKESVYKAWFPLTRRRLGFDGADIEFRRDGGAVPRGTFTARLLTSAPMAPQVFEGRWLTRAGIVLTAIAVPAGA